MKHQVIQSPLLAPPVNPATEQRTNLGHKHEQASCQHQAESRLLCAALAKKGLLSNAGAAANSEYAPSEPAEAEYHQQQLASLAEQNGAAEESGLSQKHQGSASERRFTPA